MEFTTSPMVRWAANIAEFGLEYASRRFYGLYGATVESNEDPRQQGRVSARIGVLGIGTRDDAGKFTPDVHTKMLMPMSTYAGFEHGIYFPPENGDSIYVSFDHGDGQAPRHVGSFWSNPEASKTSKGSHIPTEFKTEEGPPTKRGFKTGYGHGQIFCDDEAGPYVAIWSGKQEKSQDGAQEGKEATRNQQITLSDADSVPTVKGVDEVVQAGIYANTIYGHRVALNDTSKFVMISGLRADAEGIDANSIKIEDETSKITVKTKGVENARHEVILDDAEGKITAKTKHAQPQTIVMDSNSGNIEITSPLDTVVTATGALNVNATAASTHAYLAALTRTVGATFTDTITGALTLTIGQAATYIGQAFSWTGTTMTWVGTVFSFTGTQATITAPQVTIASANVLAGTGANQPLCNTLALTKFNLHGHVVVSAFPGFALPVPADPTTAAFAWIPGVDTTVALLGA